MQGAFSVNQTEASSGQRRMKPSFLRTLTLAAGLLWAAATPAAHAFDRFTPLIENAPESTVNANKMVVNHKRAAVQAELRARPPTEQELGLKLPRGARLMDETTARQIAQYHPVWRIYEYAVTMPRTEFIAHMEAQGWRSTGSDYRLRFPGREDFIDGFTDERTRAFRIWRKPTP